MVSLTDAFIAARSLRERSGAEGAASPVPVAPQSLEATLVDLLGRGAAAHPDLSLDGPAFAAHLGRCGAAVPAANPAVVHAEDLYLACAALQGNDVAVAKVRRIHRPVVASYLRGIDVSTPFLEEVEQRLWDAALVGAAGAEPKLATYTGQGALAGWVGIAAQRIALMIRRHEAAEERATDGAAAEIDALLPDAELAFIKGRLRVKFRQALTAALESLEDRERMIYRMHLVDGLTVEAIGKIYRVSHSTVSRWLEKVGDRIVRQTQHLLRSEMHLSPAEFESVAGLVVSQLDLSVSRLLRRAE